MLLTDKDLPESVVKLKPELELDNHLLQSRVAELFIESFMKGQSIPESYSSNDLQNFLNRIGCKKFNRSEVGH